MKQYTAVLCAIFFLMGCSRTKDTLSFNLISSAVQLDWNKANDTTSSIVLDNVMEGLTSYAGTFPSAQGEHLRPLPALAASWSIAKEGLVYRFHLREKILWSDGERLKAQHFVDSWERLLNPATKSSSSYHLFDIAGAKEYAQGTIKDFSKVGIRALGDQLLEVELTRNAPYFLHLLAASMTYPIRKDLIAKYGDSWSDPQNLVTIGPYLIKDVVPGDKMVLQANPSYWGGKPSIKTVICKMVNEPLTALTLYVNNELDILPRELPASHYDYWSKQPDYLTGAKFSVNFLVFNQRKPPFNKVENRRAFAKTFQRKELAQFFKGAQSPSSALIPPAMFAHKAEIGIGFDPEAKPSAWRQLRLRFSGADNLSLMFQQLQGSLLRRFGMDLRLEPLQWTEYTEFLSATAAKSLPLAEQPQLFYMGWIADFPDPHSFMNLFTSASDNNYAAWKNSRYDGFVEQAVETENEEKRLNLYHQAQRLLLEEEAVILPLFFSSHQALVKTNIKGVVLNPLDKWYFKTLSFTH